MSGAKPAVIFTVGHSTHPIREFLDLLEAHGIRRLVDVRTIPKSARNPQFNSDALAHALTTRGIAYTHLPSLGGLRHARKDSINTGWKNASFRGYADHMQTPEFAGGIAQLIDLAHEQIVAVMCAESVPWRCHRSLVADALTARGIEVRHIFSATSAKPHSVTPFAKIEGENVTYPGLF